jgi:hypothetical protein
MTNTSDARNIYRDSSDAPGLGETANASFIGSIVTASDPSFHAATMPTTSINNYSMARDQISVTTASLQR